MTRKRIDPARRREGGAFVPLPVRVLNSPNFIKLSPTAVKVLMALLGQLRFKDGGPVNNGDLCATWSMMRRPGIGSTDTLNIAKKELIHYGFIKLTRQGEIMRKDRPSLYAITWWAISDCDGKLDVAPTNAPTGEWKEEKPTFVKPKRG